MKIQVSTQMTIAGLQQAFSEYFPFLSLSIYSKPHDIYKACPVKYLITDSRMVLERLEKQPHNAEVSIFADMTVGDLEALFEQEFGLHVQVLRKDGESWTGTTFTDQLSLRAQNELAANAKALPGPQAQTAEYHDARTEWFLG